MTSAMFESKLTITIRRCRWALASKTRRIQDDYRVG